KNHRRRIIRAAPADGVRLLFTAGRTIHDHRRGRAPPVARAEGGRPPVLPPRSARRG
ncbi:unnamed protein product, partial [Ascophyllum nodosum]